MVNDTNWFNITWKADADVGLVVGSRIDGSRNFLL
jgi:hypothetical protein